MEFLVTRTTFGSYKYDGKNNKEIIDILGIPKDFKATVRNYMRWGTHKEKGVFIEIKTLEDLIKFKDSVNEEIIITNSAGINEIEIYDGYRE